VRTYKGVSNDYVKGKDGRLWGAIRNNDFFLTISNKRGGGKTDRIIGRKQRKRSVCVPFPLWGKKRGNPLNPLGGKGVSS